MACALERDPARSVPEPEIYAALCGRLAGHKRPRRVCFVEALPTQREKLDRAEGKRALAARVRRWAK
ncbi:MAG: hypothetical protein HY901_23040 [Deltaproteobacteria bacterium]|nr:hypothetical protein [Deltaproteobacteria bacterium]